MQDWVCYFKINKTYDFSPPINVLAVILTEDSSRGRSSINGTVAHLKTQPLKGVPPTPHAVVVAGPVVTTASTTHSSVR